MAFIQYKPSLGGVGNMDILMPEAWGIVNSSPEIVVAVIDDGVDYEHEDLKNNIWINSGEIPGNNEDDDGNKYKDDVRGWDFINNHNDPMPSKVKEKMEPILMIMGLMLQES